MILDMTTRGRPSTLPRTGFGKRVATARESAGLTQTQLGEKLGLSQRAIAHWERGTTALRPDQLEALAKAINVSTDELVSGKGSRPAETGPKGKARLVFEAVSRLPRRQQQKIVEVVEALVAQHAHTA
jgi:transcriptional regulator with XRE-family HTH domain